MSKGGGKHKDKGSRNVLDKGQTSLIDLFGRNRRKTEGAVPGSKNMAAGGKSNASSAKSVMGVGAREADSSDDDDVQIVEVVEKSKYFSPKQTSEPVDHQTQSDGSKSKSLKSIGSKLRRKSLPSSSKSNSKKSESSSSSEATSSLSICDKSVVDSAPVVENCQNKPRPTSCSSSTESEESGSDTDNVCDSQSGVPDVIDQDQNFDISRTETTKRKSSDSQHIGSNLPKRLKCQEPEPNKTETMEVSYEKFIHNLGDPSLGPDISQTQGSNKENDKCCDTESRIVESPGPDMPEAEDSESLSKNFDQESSNDQRSNSGGDLVPNSEQDSGSFQVEESQETNEAPQYKPYYIENFKLVIDTVLEDEFFNYLFDIDDLKTTDAFRSLSEPAQKLYVRLFLRKHKWLCPRKIHYPKIADDLAPYLKELVKVGFLLDETKLEGLEMCLSLLPADELRGFAKKMHVDVTNQRMPMIVEALLKQSRQRTVGAMFGMKSNLETTMLRSVKSLVGQCYCLRDVPRLVFLRLMMLFSLTSTAFEDDEQVNSQQLFQILQVNRGLVKYPDYTIQRKTKIFRSKEDLVVFQTAVNIYSDILGAIESHAFEEGVVLYKQAKALYLEHCAEGNLLKYESSLPVFLRVYTAGSVYVRILNQGVEVLQKMRNYKEANEQLEELLGQSIHCPHYRGHWWDRLALNLDQHLKSPGKALDAVGKGLHDVAVRAGRRLALYQRACKICDSPSNKKLKNRLGEFEHAAVEVAPKVTIQGRLLPKSILGSQSHFVNPEGGEEVTLCRVEQVAIAHYKKEGYDQGIHGEGSTFSTLMMLFFWDIVFMQDIPDVFYNKYQSAPLDLNCEDFYKNRKRPIQKRLKWLQAASVEDLLEHLESTWTPHEGETCAKINWERFESLDHAKTLVKAFGGKFMSQVFKRILKDPRHTSSGMPDLVVWNTTENTFRLVEVKGPGDKLSTKQILWLDYFLSHGATAEVCHVVGVGAKRLHSMRESLDH